MPRSWAMRLPTILMMNAFSVASASTATSARGKPVRSGPTNRCSWTSRLIPIAVARRGTRARLVWSQQTKWMGSPAGCVLAWICCRRYQNQQCVRIGHKNRLVLTGCGIWQTSCACLKTSDLRPPISHFRKKYKVTKSSVPFVNVQHTNPKRKEFGWIACYGREEFWFV